MINEIDITAEIQKELADLLSNSQIKTPEKARVVAGRLLRRGIQPTWRLIRDILGTGSATTLQKVVNAYWNELGSYLDKLEKRPDLPDALVKEFNNLWDKSLQLAEKQIKSDLKEEFAKINKIKEDVNKEKDAITAQLKEETAHKMALDKRVQHLEIKNNALKVELEQYERSKNSLEATIKNNKLEFSDALKAQQQTHAEQYAQLQQTYHVLEQSLEQAKQQLVAHKAQQEAFEKQSQATIADLKQGKQRELDRQAKQYDSMLEHYSNEIGRLKVKLEATEKQQQENNNKLQAQHEKNIILITELQSNVMTLTQTNKQLEKKNSDKAALIAMQQAELQQLNKLHAKLEARLEILDAKK